jgi:hypothetical protein
MHKADNSFKTSISIIVALLMAITLITPLAMPAKASSVDASSTTVSFSNQFDVLENAPEGSSHTYRGVLPNVDAIVTVIELTNHNGITDKIDSEDWTGAEDQWIRGRFDSPQVAGQYSVTGFTIDFVASGDNSRPVVVENMRLNAYDIDNRQRIEVSNVSTYQLTTGTIVNKVENLGDNTLRFTSDDVEGSNTPTSPQVHSNGEARVQINFLPTSRLTIRMGGLDGGSQDFDFSTTGEVWKNSLGATISAPTAVTPPAPASSGSSAPAPQKQHVSTLNTTPAPGQVVAMFGSYFGGVTEVYVGGVKVEILSKTENRVNIRMPLGLTGALDVELKSPLGSLLLPKHFTIGKLPAAGTRKATIIVGGFDHNSRKLTARMKARIDRWLDRNSDLSTLTCTGFTSLPRRTTDVELSTNRGTTACAYAKSQRPEVTSSVSQGVEDPRPGSNVRRVRLVLTP